MWILRYFFPGAFAVALGIFVAQNLDLKTEIQFLLWRVHDVPVVLITAMAFVIGFLVRFYVILVKLLERRRLEQATHRIISARKTEQDLNTTRNYLKDIEEVAEERMKKSIEDKKPMGSKKKSQNGEI